MTNPTGPGLARKQSTTPHYQTFPTKPPSSRGKPPSQPPPPSGPPGSSSRPRSSSSHHVSPLPKKQLVTLAIIALAEQTALNSIAPYLPTMVSTFPDVEPDEVGIYVGLVASSFALAQFATNFFWGWLSDRIGRKPVILTGTLLTAACFVAFGFSRTLWQAIIVQAIMGLVNGNQGVVSTCLGEITDRSNQSKAFTYLPVVYGIGGITGPIVGGLLVDKSSSLNGDAHVGFPFLLPNIVSACVLLFDLGITMLFLEESLEELREVPPLGRRIGNMFAWVWEITSLGRRPTRRPQTPSQTLTGQHPSSPTTTGELDDEDDEEADQSSPVLLPATDTGHLRMKDVLNKDVLLVLITFFIFQLSNIAYNSLYPIFAQARPPTGRNLQPQEIGVSLAFAGVVTIVFQVGIFGRLREKIGNKTTYRVGLAGFVVAFLLMPFVGYKDNNVTGEGSGKLWLWVELGAVLIIKTVAAVGGLTSALLLITNSARDHTVLGTLNGLAQTLSAGGRAVGPFLSGGLFSLSVNIEPKGEALAFGVFGGVSFIGFLLSFGIGGGKLEGAEWDEEEGDSQEDDSSEHEGEDEDEADNEHSSPNERTGLLNGAGKRV